MIEKKKVEKISTKALTADLIKQYSIINGAKCFTSNRLQNYIVFVPNILQAEYISNNSNKIKQLKSIRISQQSIKNPHI